MERALISMVFVSLLVHASILSKVVVLSVILVFVEIFSFSPGGFLSIFDDSTTGSKINNAIKATIAIPLKYSEGNNPPESDTLSMSERVV